MTMQFVLLSQGARPPPGPHECQVLRDPIPNMHTQPVPSNKPKKELVAEPIALTSFREFNFTLMVIN